MSKKSSFIIKNHHDDHDTKTSFNLLESKFGISKDEIINAVSGDEGAIQKIGEAQKIGQKILHFMPRISEAVRTAIKATEVYNKELGSIAQDAAKSATAINQSINSTIHGNRKYLNTLEEQKQTFQYQSTIESERHEYQTKYNQTQYIIDRNIWNVDSDAKAVDLANKPKLKQITADQAYELKRQEYLLEHGDTAPLDLINERQYVPASNQTKPKPKENLAASFLRSLGF